VSELRIGDAERDQAASALGEHYAAGRLTKEEFEQRVEQVWAARFQKDLAPVFEDLPDPRPAVRRPAVRASAPLVRPVAQPSQWPRPAVLPVVPLLLLALLAIAVINGMPWLLFPLFWLCVLAAGPRWRAVRSRGFQRLR
jgi:hypothetical protein